MAKLYFRFGAMNSGKTTVLLQTAHNYEERGMKILVIKSSIDTKGDDKVVSRLGIDRAIDIRLQPQDNVLEAIDRALSGNVFRPDALIVDEAQFLTPEQAEELYVITKVYNIPVLCYGLRCDFQMKGFPGSTRLLELADDLAELKTICRCGKKATQNVRMINGVPVFTGEQVAIDGEDSITYESMCGECYLKARGEKSYGSQIR